MGKLSGTAASISSAAPPTSCLVRSSDISDVVNEVLSHEDWRYGNTVTVLVKQKRSTVTSAITGESTTTNVNWNGYSCTTSATSNSSILQPVITGPELVQALRLASNSYCLTMDRIRSKLNTAFPLWVTPYEGLVGQSSGASTAESAESGSSSESSESLITPQSPMLSVEFCLNPECISPQFLGAGGDVLFGSHLPESARTGGIFGDIDGGNARRRMLGDKSSGNRLSNRLSGGA